MKCHMPYAVCIDHTVHRVHRRIGLYRGLCANRINHFLCVWGRHCGEQEKSEKREKEKEEESKWVKERERVSVRETEKRSNRRSKSK